MAKDKAKKIDTTEPQFCKTHPERGAIATKDGVNMCHCCLSEPTGYNWARWAKEYIRLGI